MDGTVVIEMNGVGREIKKKLEVWKGETVKFRVITELAGPDDQIKYYQIIEDLVDKKLQ